MTTTRTSALVSSWRKMLVNPSSSAVLSAFRFSGRFMVTVAMPSLVAQRISSAMVCLLVWVMRPQLSLFPGAGQGEGKAGVGARRDFARYDLSACEEICYILAEKGMRMDVVSRLKRQRAWIFLGTVASMTAVIAVVRIFNPSPLPLRFVGDFWVVAVVVIAIIIQTFYLQSVRMATELEKANTSLRAEIAERQQVESALQKSEQRYRELFENAGDIIVILTLDGTVTDVNRGAEVLVGRLREETIGRHFNDFLTPAANTQMEERFRRFYAGEEVPSVFEIE